MKRITMHQQIIILFICLVTLPLFIIFTIATNVFISNAQRDLKTIYTTNINEIGNNIDAVFTNALDLSLYPLMEESLRIYMSSDVPDNHSEYRVIKQEAVDALNSLPYGYTTNINGIGLYTESGDNIISNSNVRMSESDYAHLEGMDSSPYWDFSQCSSSKGYIYLIRHLKDPVNLPNYIGYIKLAVTGSGLKEILQQFQKDDQISYFIVTPGNSPAVWLDAGNYMDNVENLPSYTTLSRQSSEGESSWIDGQRIVSVYTLNNGLILYSITTPEVLSNIKQTFYYSIGAAEILVFFFTLLLSFYFSRLITSPLRKLEEHMTELSEEQFSDRIPVKGCYEIQMLSKTYNHMAERLEFLYNEVYMGELRLKQSRLDALQIQLNPHFLYNTLDTIYWMSKMGESENTSIMVSNLSKMMRMTLEPGSNNNMVTLGRELEHLTCYITIQQIRYGEKVRFSVVCEESLKKLPVLSFLLQPLVENALVHGLKKSLNGIVKINIFTENSVLVYEVANNGIPVDIEKIHNLLAQKPNGSQGFAIYNIHERIRLKYGTDYGLSCNLNQGFTVFKVTQPVFQQPEENKET